MLFSLKSKKSKLFVISVYLWLVSSSGTFVQAGAGAGDYYSEVAELATLIVMIGGVLHSPNQVIETLAPHSLKTESVSQLFESRRDDVPFVAGDSSGKPILELLSYDVDGVNFDILLNDETIVYSGVSSPWVVDRTLPDHILTSEHLDLTRWQDYVRHCSDSRSSSASRAIQNCDDAFVFLLDKDSNGYLVVVVVSVDERGNLIWKTVSTGRQIYSPEGQQLLLDLLESGNVVLFDALISSDLAESGEPDLAVAAVEQVNRAGSTLPDRGDLYTKSTTPTTVPGVHTAGRNGSGPRRKGGAGFGHSVHTHTPPKSVTPSVIDTGRQKSVEDKAASAQIGREAKPPSKAAKKNQKRKEKRGEAKTERERHQKEEAEYLKVLKGSDINPTVITSYLKFKRGYMTNENIIKDLLNLALKQKISEKACSEILEKMDDSEK